VVLSLIWAICSLPVITAGAATTAVFDVCGQILRKEDGYMWPSFRKSFKANFRQATPLWLFFGITGFLLVFNLRLLAGQPQGDVLAKAVLFGFLTVVLVMTALADLCPDEPFCLSIADIYPAGRGDHAAAYGKELCHPWRCRRPSLCCTWYCPPLFVIFFGLYAALVRLILDGVFRSYEALIRGRSHAAEGVTA